VTQSSGRRPSSISWMSSTRRAVSGVAIFWAAPAATTGPSWASTSVLRLRTARSRQMPLWVLAERRLKATSASREALAAASLARAGGDDLFIEPVLQRDDTALLAQQRRQRGDRDRHIRRLGAKENRVEPSLEIGGRRGRGLDVELGDRPGDSKPVLVHRRHMI